jgi:hypothetical protein
MISFEEAMLYVGDAVRFCGCYVVGGEVRTTKVGFIETFLNRLSFPSEILAPGLETLQRSCAHAANRLSHELPSPVVQWPQVRVLISAVLVGLGLRGPLL